MGEVEPARGAGGEGHALVVDRDDGVEGVVARESRDLLGAGFGVVVVEVEDVGGGQGGRAVAADHGLDAQALGGGKEVVGAVGGAGDEEKDARHTVIVMGGS